MTCGIPRRLRHRRRHGSAKTHERIFRLQHETQAAVAAHSAGLNYVGAHTTVEFDQVGFWESLGVPVGEPPSGGSTDPGANATDLSMDADTTADGGIPSPNREGGVSLSEHRDAGQGVDETAESGN